MWTPGNIIFDILCIRILVAFIYLTHLSLNHRDVIESLIGSSGHFALIRGARKRETVKRADQISESEWYHSRFNLSLFIYNFSLSLGSGLEEPRGKIPNDILQRYHWHTLAKSVPPIVVIADSLRSSRSKVIDAPTHTCVLHILAWNCVRVIHSRSLPFRQKEHERPTGIFTGIRARMCSR